MTEGKLSVAAGFHWAHSLNASGFRSNTCCVAYSARKSYFLCDNNDHKHVSALCVKKWNQSTFPLAANRMFQNLKCIWCHVRWDTVHQVVSSTQGWTTRWRMSEQMHNDGRIITNGTFQKRKRKNPGSTSIISVLLPFSCWRQSSF